ncbi:flagellar basal-body rod protein FlgG [Calditerricola yamamurae]
MNTSALIAAGALRTLQERIDVTAHNLANLDTPGYKRRDAVFAELLYTQVNNQPVREQEAGRLTPPGLRVGYGMHLAATPLSLTQGVMRETNRPLDLAIEGDGFFLVEQPVRDGAGQAVDENGRPIVRRALTRAGAFHLSPLPDGSGRMALVTPQGDFVVRQGAAPGDPNRYVVLDPLPSGRPVSERDLVIDASGRIFVQEGDRTIDTGLRIGLWRVPSGERLRSIGENRFAADENELVPVDPGGTGEGARVTIRQGMLEGSNVELVKEMTDLLTAQRAYSLNLRALQMADEMWSLANQMRR